MPQSLAKILLHVIYSTKDREPFLAEAEVRRNMHSYLATSVQRVRVASAPYWRSRGPRSYSLLALAQPFDIRSNSRGQAE